MMENAERKTKRRGVKKKAEKRRGKRKKGEEKKKNGSRPSIHFSGYTIAMHYIKYGRVTRICQT